MLKRNALEQLLRVETGTQHRYFEMVAKRRGQYTSLVVYDPCNRGSDFVANILVAAGLDLDINDEGEPVTLAEDHRQAGI